jgi:glutamate dehydrogenase (NAD(P)+)
LQHLKLDVSKATVAVQGFGNVGSNTALIMQQAGARVVAVSDVSGGLYNPKGLDIAAVLHRYRDKHEPLCEIKLGESITNEELLQLDCTVLVPSRAFRANYPGQCIQVAL